MRPVYRRREARRDIAAAANFYLSEASERVAVGFIDAVEEAVEAIREYPDAGSPRIGHESAISGLLSRLTKGYPYFIFYRVAEGQIEILRVLHTSRDLPAILSTLDD